MDDENGKATENTRFQFAGSLLGGALGALCGCFMACSGESVVGGLLAGWMLGEIIGVAADSQRD